MMYPSFWRFCLSVRFAVLCVEGLPLERLISSLMVDPSGIPKIFL